MTNEHVTDRLEEYVAGGLDPAETKAVASHLDACESCAAEARAIGPVELAGLPFDDAGIGRTVRKALRRTAVDAAALTLIILLGGLLVSLFVVQPLIMNRSDRAAVAARAVHETPMLFLPGLEVLDFQISSGLFDRDVVAETRLPLGSGSELPGTANGRIGLFSIDIEWRPGPSVHPVLLQDVLPGLDDGTVVTVAVETNTPLTVDEAQSLADEPGHDVRITWVGFDVLSSNFGTVGYPLCVPDLDLREDFYGASSAGFSGTGTGTLPSVERALERARDALNVIASQDEVANALGGSAQLESLARAMDGTRHVRTLVATGPTPEVARFLDDLGVSGGQVLSVGFYSWGGPVCGR
ncbi:MAG TPA: zf-HC2 domain-containing protein [Acidimicrobiia bacterium]|nr:zf-HC2 domain-containing protein [Acidimicrobiia bacterium]